MEDDAPEQDYELHGQIYDERGELCPRCETLPDRRLYWHTCPFETELNDDYKHKCRCCDSCEVMCAGST